MSRTVVVTGASAGVGRAAAVAFASRGDRVGLVGSTGLSIGAHLHLQLEIGGVPTDPLPLAGCDVA